MKSSHITEINVYHTPDKVSKPDLKSQSHLKNTIPTGYQFSNKPKNLSQFASHRKKMANYQNQKQMPPFTLTEKRASKNLWELKEKIDQYQSQIRLLREYLRGTHCNCIQKSSISRIFGFASDEERFASQQELVIKQLGSKVRNLVKQNASLKYQNAHFQHLHIEQIIQQNEKLQKLLQNYKINDSLNHRRLTEQSQLLKDEIYHLKLEYEQKLKLMEIEHKVQLNQLKVTENELLRKLQVSERRNQQNIRQTTHQNEKLAALKISEIQQIHRQQLKSTENIWRKKLQDLEKYYLNLKNELQENYKKQSSKLSGEQLNKIKQTYIRNLQQLETQQNLKLQKLQQALDTMKKRLQGTNQSIAHLKFERQNRIQSTIRKSINIATSSSKPKGDIPSEPAIEQIQEHAAINARPLNYSLNLKSSTQQANIMREKSNFYEKEINQFKIKLAISQKIINQKTQKVLILQNQIRNLNITIHSLKLNAAKDQVKEIIKQVHVAVPLIPKEYSQEVKSIKESIKSCNLSNFDIFETEFNEIVGQRNQMNQKLLSLKNEAKESSKVLILQKHLKVQREKNKLLEQKVKKYEQEIQNLKIEIIQLQSQFASLQSKLTENYESEMSYGLNPSQLPDGKAGIEWQKVVKHCLLTSISRLQNLQNKMREQNSKNR